MSDTSKSTMDLLSGASFHEKLKEVCDRGRSSTARPPRPTRDVWLLNMAKLVARRSTCARREVGCVLIDRFGHVLATGYNGVARGLPHCNEEVLGARCSGADASSGSNLDACEAIHAEQNALLQCRDVELISACYVTVSPCVTCTKLLMNTSCRRIVFAEPYATEAGSRRLWEKAGREWTFIEP